MSTCITTVSGNAAVLTVHEDIDLTTRPRIEEAAHSLPRAVNDVTLALTDATFMDVSGLRLLRGLRDRAASGHGEFAVTGLGLQPIRLLRLAAEIAPEERWEDFLPAPAGAPAG